MSTCISDPTAIQGAVAPLLIQEQNLRQCGLELVRLQVFQISLCACCLAVQIRLQR